MADRTLWTNAVPGGNVLVVGDNVFNFKAGEAITRGMAVAIHGTGIDWTVHPATLGTTKVPIGIATETVASGCMCPVAGIGCIAYCQQETDGTDLDAGTRVVQTDSAGFVGAEAGTAPEEYLIGVLLEASDASALTYERILVLAGLPTQTHA
jgi:hypothetical protein